jgi:hypothetical protein
MLLVPHASGLRVGVLELVYAGGIELMKSWNWEAERK